MAWKNSKVMIPRVSHSIVSQLLVNFPAVALLGSRQVGKTTLALDLIENKPNATYLDLENPADKLKIASDPADYFARHAGELLVLDEIHRLPDLFPILRGVIDRQRRKKEANGQFLLLGSASMDLLVDLLLVRRLQPWSGNVIKRLAKRPKVYVRDSGIVHALLGLSTAEQILANMISGPSWEGFAVENILAAVPVGTQSFYYRTGAGAEIDLVLDLGSSEVSSKTRDKPWAMEMKRSSTPSVSKGFHTGSADIKAGRKLIVHPGNGTFSLGQGIEAIGLLDLILELRKLS
jgi:predicted AAA+ superfamily ATPase